MDVVRRLGVRIEMHWPLFSIGTLQLNSSPTLFIWIFSEAIHWKQNFISYISVNHSLKINTSAQSFSEPFTENSTNRREPDIQLYSLHVEKSYPDPITKTKLTLILT